jgi:hypothetical protein
LLNTNEDNNQLFKLGAMCSSYILFRTINDFL